MQPDKELVATVKTSIFEKEANTDTLRFLIPPYYGDIDLSKSTVLVKYVTPDRKNRAEQLIPTSKLYKGYLDYRLNVDTDITSLPGDVDMRLSFIQVDKAEGSGLQTEVLHSGNIVITVDPLKNLYGFNCDESLEVIDRMVGQVNSKIEALNNIATSLDKEKADDIEMVGDEIWAMSNGEKIGDPIKVEDISSDEDAESAWEEL